MKISEVVNQYARTFSPYASDLVNHLPMGQLALYMMGNDVEKIASYSESYIKSGRIDKIKVEFSPVETITECVGKRDLYEACLLLIEKEIQLKGVEKVIAEVLNSYPLGISSGLFHTTIRLAYAVEGMKLDQDLEEEVARALAYYITAYREGSVFNKKVNPSRFLESIEKVFNNGEIIELLKSNPSRGKKLHALYNDSKYMEMGLLIDGSNEEKVVNLLELLLPILDETDSILVLHCITGLQALLVLEDYFNNFSYILDIMTTYIITHLLTADNEGVPMDLGENKSWDNIIRDSSNSTNVHTIKYAYSTSELYKKYNIDKLRQSAQLRAMRN
ncbi:MAG: questin oxidase family protein [Candidatus Scalindua sp.]|nr:questin oxidase family protein [Candidatus Scalindua sp.]